jgi:protein ImuA
METATDKQELIAQLRAQILSLQGVRVASHHKQMGTGLGLVQAAFPQGAFPVGAMHEFISTDQGQSAATSGFMAALAGLLMKQEGICLWVGMRRTVFPPALSFFGVAPERVIFIDVKKECDLLWMIEEGLRCQALSAVVGQVQEIGLTASRRLQLACEQSRVTGLLHRVSPRSMNPVAAVCRWQITPLPTEGQNELPGVGHPRWNVELLKIRNGQPGSWQVEWQNQNLKSIITQDSKDKGDLLQVG